MITKNRRSNWHGAALLLFAACNPGAPAAPEKLAAVIGRAGGSLTGPAGSVFEGVRLTIPAGALAADTSVTISGVVDPTPLHADAERVGPQLRLEPADVVLAAPVSLTLPIDADLVDRYLEQPADCKVWVRATDGWQAVEQTASTADTVTIDLAAFTTAAAGVRLLPPIPPSAVVCPSCVLARLGCTNPSGFCVESVATLDSAAVGIFAVEAGAVYAVTEPAASTVEMLRVDLATRAATSPFAVFSSSLPVYILNLAVDADHSVWFGTKSATLHLRQGNATEQFDLGFNGGLGAVTYADGSLLRLSRSGTAYRRAGVFGPVVPWGLVPSETGTAEAAGASGDRFWRVASAGLIEACGVSGCDPSRDAGIRPNLGLPAPLQQILDPKARIVVGKGGSYSPPLAVRIEGGGVLRWDTDNTFVQDLVPVSGIFDIAMDDDGGLWMTLTRSAQVVYRTAGGAFTTATLSSADPTSPDYLARLPRRIRVLPDGSAVVMTQGHEVLHLRRNLN